MQTIETPSTSQPKTKAIDFGNGRYSPLMRESFSDLTRIFGVIEEIAEKVAKDIGREFGALQGSGSIGVSKVSLGKLNKDAQFTTVKEAASTLKKVNATTALQVLQVIAWLNDSPYGFDAQSEKVKLVKVEKLVPQAAIRAYLGFSD